MRKEKRYPLWSAKIIILLSLLALGLSTGLVFVLGHKSVFAELQITLAVVSVFLFAFLTCGLYMGVRIKNDPLIKGKWELVRDIDIFDVGSHLNIIEFSDGIAGFIFSVIVWLILSVILLLMLLVFANVLWGVIFIMGIVIYWLFYRAFRLVFIKSRICRGNFVFSFGYSLWYTFLYTGWMYALIIASRYL